MQVDPDTILATAHDAPEGDVTFKGRGQAHRTGNRLLLQVCPQCSQRNDHSAVSKGYCFWCAYVPSLDDVRPAI